MAIAEVEYREHDVFVTFPYVEHLIFQLKDQIPAYARSWDGDSDPKGWVFDPAWWDVAQGIIEGYHDIVD